MAIDAGYTITALSGKDGQSGDSISVQYAPTDTTPQGQRHDTFQSGDKYMWQKIGDGSWSSAMKIVGEDGKNAITMTSATTPSGEYEGQIGVWQGQIYKWTSNAWVNQNANVPTDAVLHYSFDEVPDYPDGTADVRLIDNNTYDIQSMDCKFVQNQATFTNNNGKLQMTVNMPNVTQWFAYIPYGYTQNKIVKIKLTIESLGSGVSILIRNGFDKTVATYNKTGTYEISFISNSTYTYPNVYLVTTAGQSVILIDEIYIGDGSYSTPVIDNANGQWNSIEQRGVAVQGVSGKAIRFLGNNYVQGNLPWKPYDKGTFTVSCWVKNWDKENGWCDVISNWSDYRVTPLWLSFSNTINHVKSIRFDVPNKSNGNILRYCVNAPDLDWNNFNTDLMHIVAVFNATNSALYINGQKINLTFDTVFDLGSGADRKFFYIGRHMTEGNVFVYTKATFDDFLVFDRALSDTEVLALYLNKANTPKYYTLSDYNLDAIDDDKVIDHLTEKPQLLSRWLEIYNAKNVTSALPTSNVSASGEYKGVIDSANEVGVIETDAVQAYITASNALRSALWGTNGYLVDMNKDSVLSGSLDSLFSTYRQTLQKARTVISEQQASSASALTIVNSNPFCLIPVNAGGTVTTYANTGLRLQVFNGVTQLTPKASSATLSEGQWKVTANGSNITAGSQTVGNGYIDFGNVSALNADTAVITFTITALVNGVTNTLYTTQKFSKSKEGAGGRIYSLQTDTGTIAKADSGTLTPSSVTVKAYSWTGSASPSLYGNGDLKAYENNAQVGSTVSQGNTITVTPSGDYPLVVKLFVHGTNTLLDTLTIPVLKDGHSPTVSATTQNGTTTISVDGTQQAEIKETVSSSISGDNFSVTVGTDMKPTDTSSHTVTVSAKRGTTPLTAIRSGTPTANQFLITVGTNSKFTLGGSGANVTVTAKATSVLSNKETVTLTLTYSDGSTETKLITITPAIKGTRSIRYLGKSATKPNSSSQTSGAPTGLDTPIQGDWYFCTTDGAVYYCSGISGSTYTWTVITWLDTSTVPDYRLTACLEDMLELSDQITTNQTMNNFIDKYTTVLIANEGFINKLRAKDINFKNSVSSYKDSGYVAGDLAISMGKNPKNASDDDLNFIIQSYRGKMDNNDNTVWNKELYTKYNGKESDFYLNGMTNSVLGFKTLNDLYVGSEKEVVSLLPNGDAGFNVEYNPDVCCYDGEHYYVFKNVQFSPNESEKLYVYLADSLDEEFSIEYATGSVGRLYDAINQKNGHSVWLATATGVYFFYYNTTTGPSEIEKIANYAPYNLNYIDGTKLNLSNAQLKPSNPQANTLYITLRFDGQLHFYPSYNGAIYGLSEFTDGVYTACPIADSNVAYQSTFGTPTLVFYDKNMNVIGSKTFSGKSVSDAGTITQSSTIYSHNGIIYMIAKCSGDNNLHLLTSSDCGTTWKQGGNWYSKNESRNFTPYIEVPSNFNSPRFYAKDSLIILKEAGCYIYSTDNGRYWRIYKSEVTFSYKCGSCFEAKTDEYDDVLIPVGNANKVLTIHRLRAVNLSKPQKLRIQTSRPANPQNGDIWID